MSFDQKLCVTSILHPRSTCIFRACRHIKTSALLLSFPPQRLHFAGISLPFRPEAHASASISLSLLYPIARRVYQKAALLPTLHASLPTLPTPWPSPQRLHFVGIKISASLLASFPRQHLHFVGERKNPAQLKPECKPIATTMSASHVTSRPQDPRAVEHARNTAQEGFHHRSLNRFHHRSLNGFHHRSLNRFHHRSLNRFHVPGQHVWASEGCRILPRLQLGYPVTPVTHLYTPLMKADKIERIAESQESTMSKE